MRSMKWLLAALILTQVVACSGLNTSSGPASNAQERSEFGNFGYDDMYRYYGGLSAVSEQTDVRQQRDRSD